MPKDVGAWANKTADEVARAALLGYMTEYVTRRMGGKATSPGVELSEDEVIYAASAKAGGGGGGADHDAPPEDLIQKIRDWRNLGMAVQAVGWFKVESNPRFNARNRSRKTPVSSAGFNWELAPLQRGGGARGEALVARFRWGAVQARPWLESNRFQKFDCEKDITVLSTRTLVF